MKMLSFAGRTAKEILRDPLNLFFGLGFPVILLLLLSAIQAKIPVPLFAIESLTPGILVFGLSFMTLFAATLVAKDRESAFLQRLYTTPLRAVDFICGYILPLLPIALLQGAICCAAAFCLGLAVSVRVLFVLLLLLPTALVFISLGVLCGSVLTVKQVGRHLRGTAHEPHRLAVRRVVRPLAGGRRFRTHCDALAVCTCSGDGTCRAGGKRRRHFSASLVGAWLYGCRDPRRRAAVFAADAAHEINFQPFRFPVSI